MDYIALIREKYGDTCRLCPPLAKADCEAAEQQLPAELLSILERSNGIEELLTLPDANDGEPFPVGYIVDPYQGILAQTAYFSEFWGEDGIAFAGNGAGGCYVLKEDGSVWLFEFPGEDGDLVADDLAGFFKKA